MQHMISASEAKAIQNIAVSKGSGGIAADEELKIILGKIADEAKKGMIIFLIGAIIEI